MRFPVDAMVLVGMRQGFLGDARVTRYVVCHLHPPLEMLSCQRRRVCLRTLTCFLLSLISNGCCLLNAVLDRLIQTGVACTLQREMIGEGGLRFKRVLNFPMNNIVPFIDSIYERKYSL